eukprot:gene2277-3137_t
MYAHTRAVQCSSFVPGPNGLPADCIWYPGKTAVGNVWVGEVDTATGAGKAIPGITQALSGAIEAHGNFAEDPSAPGSLYLWVYPNATSLGLAQLDLGMGKVGWWTIDAPEVAEWFPASWMQFLPYKGTRGLASWRYMVEMSTGGGNINITETLNVVKGLNQGGDGGQATSQMVYKNVSETSAPVTDLPPAFYGFQHAMDRQAGILYAQSRHQGITRLDLTTGSPSPTRLTVQGNPELLCLFYDEQAGLGGLVAGDSQQMTLVHVDTKSGAATHRLAVPSFAPLSLYRLNSELDPPMCSFSSSEGVLYLVLADLDMHTSVFASVKSLSLVGIDVRKPSIQK